MPGKTIGTYRMDGVNRGVLFSLTVNRSLTVFRLADATPYSS